MLRSVGKVSHTGSNVKRGELQGQKRHASFILKVNAYG